jgi:hypothetical protein
VIDHRGVSVSRGSAGSKSAMAIDAPTPSPNMKPTIRSAI